MGAGASMAERQSAASASCYVADPSSLPSVEDIHAAHLQDKYRVAFNRSKMLLDNEAHHCAALGFESHARHHQPLMREKLDRSLRTGERTFARTLCTKDVVGGSYGDDLQRHHGHTEVPVHALTDGGSVHQLCALPNSPTIVCASSSGPLWVYNWREGAVVSQMRSREQGSAAVGKGTSAGLQCDGAVVRLCVGSEDGSHLASGDEYGFLQLWDLTAPSLACQVRLHQGAMTGLRRAQGSGLFFTASTDTYIMVYDAQQQMVLEGVRPKSLTCGDGIPSTALALAGEGRSKLILVGGTDGKLRCWVRDDGPTRKLCTVPCGFAQPSEILMAANGFHAAVATVPADPVLSGAEPARGGLLLLDIRKLGDDGGSACVAEHHADGNHHCELPEFSCAAPPGTVDMALAEEGGKTVALCLTDGVVRAFDLGQPRLSHNFDFDVVARHDGGLYPSPYPCAVATAGSYVFTATTAPSLSIWRRPPPGELYGHSDYVQPWIPPPMVLRSRCVPEKSPNGRAAGRSLEVGAGPMVANYGTTLATIQRALEHDRWKLGEGAVRPELPDRPEVPTLRP